MTQYYGQSTMDSTGLGRQPAVLAFEEEDQTYVPESMPAPEPYQDFATGPVRFSRTDRSSPPPRTKQSQSRSLYGYEQRSGYVPMGTLQRDQAQYHCTQGYHRSGRKFGLCGICFAVLLFPLGLVCLFLDSEKRCKDCGVVIGSNSSRPYH